MLDLTKGRKIDLVKDVPGGEALLENMIAALSWDANQYATGGKNDLDLSLFLVGADGKVQDVKNFVYFKNLQNPNGSVKSLTGDNTTGEGDGWDEQIQIKLNEIPADVDAIWITATVYNGPETHADDPSWKSFGQVENAKVALLNGATGNQEVNYDLCEDYSGVDALIAARIYRHNGSWKFEAKGEGLVGGLRALLPKFGLN